MIPVGSRLIRHKIVHERRIGRNGTLSDTRNTVHEVGAPLEHAMPMLLDGKQPNANVCESTMYYACSEFISSKGCQPVLYSYNGMIALHIYYFSALMEVATYAVSFTLDNRMGGPGWRPLMTDALRTLSMTDVAGPGDVLSKKTIWSDIAVLNV